MQRFFAITFMIVGGLAILLSAFPAAASHAAAVEQDYEVSKEALKLSLLLVGSGSVATAIGCTLLRERT